MKKPFFSLLVFVFFCALLSGCQGYREIDSEYLITAIGFGKKAEEYAVYTEVLSVGADKKDTESKLFSALGKTPYEAVENIAGLLPKKAVFDHCGTAVIDSETEGAKFKEIMEYLYDTKNLNLGICLYCTKSVDKVLSQKPQTSGIGYDIMAIKNNLEKTTGIPFKNKYYEICAAEMEKGAFCLPEINAKEKSIEISSQTVYSGFLPAVHLEKSEMFIFNMLSYGSKEGEISLDGKKYRFNRVSVKTEKEKDKMKIEIHCKSRNKKSKRAKALKRAAEAVIERIKSTLGAALISPHLAAAKNVKVIVYEN